MIIARPGVKVPGMVPAATPVARVRGFKDSFDFGSRQVTRQGAFATLFAGWPELVEPAAELLDRVSLRT